MDLLIGFGLGTVAGWSLTQLSVSAYLRRLNAVNEELRTALHEASMRAAFAEPQTRPVKTMWDD